MEGSDNNDDYILMNEEGEEKLKNLTEFSKEEYKSSDRLFNREMLIAKYSFLVVFLSPLMNLLSHSK